MGSDASQTGECTGSGSLKLSGVCQDFDSRNGSGIIRYIDENGMPHFAVVEKSQLFCRNGELPSLACGEPVVFELKRREGPWRTLWKAVNVTGPDGDYCKGIGHATAHREAEHKWRICECKEEVADDSALGSGRLTRLPIIALGSMHSTKIPQFHFEKGSAERSVVASRMPLRSVPHLIVVVILYCDYGTRMNISQISELTSAVTNMCVSDARNALGSLPFAVSRPPKVPTIRCGNEQLPKIVEETSHEFIAILPQCFLYFGKAKKQWVVAKHCTEGVHSAVFGWKPPAKKNSQRPIRDPISEKPTVKLSTLWQATAGDSSDWKVNSMANCGETIAVGTAECLALLNAQTGAVVTKSLGNHIHIAFLGEERIVGVMEDERYKVVLREFNAKSLSKALPIKMRSIESVKASANGKRLYVCGNNTIRSQVFEYSTAKWLLAAEINLSSHYRGQCDIAANGLLAQGFEYIEHYIKVLETSTRCVTQTIRTKHTDRITQVAFSPDSSRIVSVSGDTTVQLFDAITGQIIGEPRVAHTNLVSSICWLTDDCFVTVSSDKSLVVWHCDSQPPIARIQGAHRSSISSVLRLSTDSFVTGDHNGVVKKWKLELE